MCGIAGAMAFSERGRASLAAIEDATSCLRRRGPDAEGVVSAGSVALGHRRLAVIDLSPQANQPMSDGSGRYTIVYNGEVYNFRELRQALQADGAEFTTESDTEVVLQLYIRRGTDFLHGLNGFFALAILDREEERLVVARDRIGIKPLYYYADDDRFVFASEMKALLAFPIPRELDPVSLYQYLQLTYVPAPATILRGVHKLEPGCRLDVRAGHVESARYYQIPYAPAAPGSVPPFDAAKRRLVELVESAVDKRLVADVPVGAFLSGGVDSSIVAAMACRHARDLRTFSIGFRDHTMHDESEFAERVAAHVGSRHTTFHLDNDDLYGTLFDALDYIDEPFADSSALAVQVLSRRTREAVTVALSGDGADELFGGYNKHLAEARLRRGGIGGALVRMLSAALSPVPRSRDTKVGNRLRQLDRLAAGTRLEPADRYWAWCSFTPEREALQMLGARFKSNGTFGHADEMASRKRAITDLIGRGGMNDVLYADARFVLPNDMLFKVDAMSMSQSLEVRVPFLDHNVVEFAFGLPASYKIGARGTKRILREAFRSFLPAEVFTRPKHGFEVPLMKWFQTDLREHIERQVFDEPFVVEQAVFDAGAMKRLRERLFSSNPGDVAPLVWSLIVFQSWWKRHMASQPAAGGAS